MTSTSSSSSLTISSSSSSSSLSSSLLSPTPSSSSGYSSSIFSLLIISRSGGLIYHKDFNSSVRKIPPDEIVTLASIFHSLHAITEKGIQINPTTSTPSYSNPHGINEDDSSSLFSPPPSGIISLLSSNFRLQCYQTPTGLKFLMTAQNTMTTQFLSAVLLRVYNAYCDTVAKNPFYEMELQMPIKVETFDQKIIQIIANSNSSIGGNSNMG